MVRLESGWLTLVGRVLSPDGARKLEFTARAEAADTERLGRQVADALLAEGAAGLIELSRQA